MALAVRRSAHESRIRRTDRDLAATAAFLTTSTAKGLDTTAWFWDSNLGQDYPLSKSSLATDE
jgi:hypothetical protein